MSNATPIEAGSTRLPESASPCWTCGACCSFAPDWPRFTTEEDSALDRIPGLLVAADLSGMRCNGNRCSALVGEVGISTSCMIYDARPDVCRACVAGDEACGMARSRFGLPALAL
ncbi:MAG TPA: YkgJ family cysteine cluster protein [Dongiaceae bacterium]|nr:YkgJ family cysteine cluster protein [Dongiaceae bacterium]